MWRVNQRAARLVAGNRNNYSQYLSHHYHSNVPLNVLVSIHGYPRRYNAGSEVYTQTLALGLAKRGVPVSVFAREEDPFKPDYSLSIEHDPLSPSVPVHLVNHARSNIRFKNEGIDNAFEEVLHKVKPNIVHMGHLNHLSTGLVSKAKDYGAKIVFTLHDFWLMCPRGQFLQIGLDSGEPWKLCSGQEDHKCATKCMNRFHSGEVQNQEQDINYWTQWVNHRMQEVKQVSSLIDLFIAPSEHLQKRFVDEFHLPLSKVKYIDYGFDISRLPEVAGNNCQTNNGFVFGYIGRHHPSKGIDRLIKAFSKVEGKAKLIIWGRHEGQLTASLKSLAQLILGKDKSIEWRSEYKNENIVQDVFSHCDCIVVPSIWDENSPLVIHEAQQVRLPVITAEHGGMSEFVKDAVNGITFKHRDDESLTQSLQKAVNNPEWIRKLGLRGYIKSSDGNIPSIDEHVGLLTQEYYNLLHSPFSNSNTSKHTITSSAPKLYIQTRQMHTTPPITSQPPPISQMEVPWRITFDTNPDDCNLRCIMCEEHSVYSKSQEERRASGNKKRRMDVAIIEKVVAECAGKGLREIIPSTMGEPLMYKDFPAIVDICKKYNIRMNLTTNGTFIGRGVHEWGNMILPIASDIKISWNGATKETAEKVMIGSRFEKQLENLKAFIALRDTIAITQGNRATITLQLTFMEVNLQDIPKIVKLAVSLGVDRVKGHHLWAHFDPIKEYNMRRTKESIVKWNNVVRECKQIANETPLPNGKTIALENIFELNENATDEIHPQAQCPFLGKEAWVNHEGRFDPCCAPDKERKKLGHFGGVQGNGLLKIWNGDQYKELVKNYHDNDLCKGCNMRKL